MEALHRTSTVPISFEALPSKEDGYFNRDDQRIAIREGMSQVQTVCATVHEIAHSVLHNQVVTEKMNPTLYTIAEICHTPALYHKERVPQKSVPKNLYRYEVRMGADGQFNAVGKHIREGFGGTIMTAKPLPVPDKGIMTLDPAAADKSLLLSAGRCTIGHFQREFVKDQHTEEVEAESVSYAVCQYFGIETSSNSFGYIATWSKGKELNELKASLETITSATKYLITNIDKHFKEICKERGINLDGQTAQSAETVKDGGAVQQDAGQNTVTDQAALSVTAGTVPESGQPVMAEAAVTADTQTAAQSAEAEKPVQDTASVTDGPEVPEQTVQPEANAPAPASTPETVAAEVTADRPSEPPESPPPAETSQAEIKHTTEQKQEARPEQGKEAEKASEEGLEMLQSEFWEGLHPLDQYPAPDEHIAIDALVVAGYKGDDLLAVTRDRACELMDQDMTVYTVMTGENPEMAFDSEDIRQQPEKAFFAVPREEWEASPQFHASLDERLEHQAERQEAFIRHSGASFGVYRLREDSGVTPVEMRVMRESGNVPDRKNYNLVYTGKLAGRKNIHEALKLLNENPPPDFPGSAPIFGDVIAIKNDNSIFCYYL